VAGTTGAEFFAARDDERLTKVYEELGSRLGHRDERKEVTVAFAGGAGVLLLVAGALSMLLFRRLP
jgi:Ca-activated chloride channel family protein